MQQDHHIRVGDPRDGVEDGAVANGLFVHAATRGGHGVICPLSLGNQPADLVRTVVAIPGPVIAEVLRDEVAEYPGQQQLVAHGNNRAHAISNYPQLLKLGLVDHGPVVARD